MKKIETTEIAVATVSLILGTLLGTIIQNLLGSSTSTSNWLVACAIICCFISSLLVFRYVSSMTDLVEKSQAVVDEALKYRAEIIPRELVYKEMAKCLLKARFEVAIVTFFMYDWESGKRTFLPPEQKISGKEDFYKAVFACIENPKVEYIRVWQVPPERRSQALAAIESDPTYKKEIDLIRKISKQSPDRARFVIEDELTTASFILVDQQHLFFNVDFYDRERKIWHSPYMIFVRDATEQAFAGLNSIIVRLTSRFES